MAQIITTAVELFFIVGWTLIWVPSPMSTQQYNFTTQFPMTMTTVPSNTLESEINPSKSSTEFENKAAARQKRLLDTFPWLIGILVAVCLITAAWWIHKCHRTTTQEDVQNRSYLYSPRTVDEEGSHSIGVRQSVSQERYSDSKGIGIPQSKKQPLTPTNSLPIHSSLSTHLDERQTRPSSFHGKPHGPIIGASK